MFIKMQNEIDHDHESEKYIKDSTIMRRDPQNVLGPSVLPKLEIPFSVKDIISRIERAQLHRAREDIDMQLSEIMNNVHRIMTRYTLLFNSPSERNVSLTEHKRKQRTSFLEKMATYAKTVEIREKTLVNILVWLEEWNAILSEMTLMDADEHHHWIAQMEMLPETLKAIDNNVKILSRFSIFFLDEKRKQKKKILSRGTLWKSWKERVMKRPATAHALRPDQMISNQFATNTKVSEIQGMLQELIATTMFSTLENNAIKYISSTIVNLSKALSTLSDELKCFNFQSSTIYEHETSEAGKELSLKIIQDLSNENEMLQQKLHDAEEKCEQLLRSKIVTEQVYKTLSSSSTVKALSGSSPQSSRAIIKAGDIEDNTDNILDKELENIVDEVQRKRTKGSGIKWDSTILYTAQVETTPDLTEQQQQPVASKDISEDGTKDYVSLKKGDEYQAWKKKHTKGTHVDETSEPNLSDNKGGQKVSEANPSQYYEPLEKKRKEKRSFSEVNSKAPTEAKGQHLFFTETKSHSGRSRTSIMLEQFRKVKRESPFDRRPTAPEIKVEPTTEALHKESKGEIRSLVAPLSTIQSDYTAEPQKGKIKGKKHHISSGTTTSKEEKTEEKEVLTKQVKSHQLVKSLSRVAKEISESTRVLESPDGKSEQSDLEEFQNAIMAFLKQKIDNIGKPFDKKTVVKEEELLKRAEAEKLGIIKAKMEEYFQKVAETVTKILRKYKDKKKEEQVRKPKKQKKVISFMPGLHFQKSESSSFLSHESIDPVINNLIQMILAEIESETDVSTVSTVQKDHKEREEQRQEQYLQEDQEQMSGMSLTQQLLEERNLLKEHYKKISENWEEKKAYRQMKEGKQEQQREKQWQEEEIWKTEQKQRTPKQTEQEEKQKQRGKEEEELPESSLQQLEEGMQKMKAQGLLLEKENGQMRQIQKEMKHLGPIIKQEKKKKRKPERGLEDLERQRQTETKDRMQMKKIKLKELEKVVIQTPMTLSPRWKSAVKDVQQLYQGEEFHRNLKTLENLPDEKKPIPVTPPSPQSSPPGALPISGQPLSNCIHLTPQQAQKVEITLTPQQAQELGIPLTPQQSQELGIPLTPQQAQELGIPLTPQQAQGQGITVTSQQAQELGITLTPQQAQAQGITLTPQQAQAQGITLTPQQAQALGIPLTPQQAQAQGITLTPQQAQALGIPLTPQQAQAQGITLSPQQAQALGIPLTPQQPQVQKITLTPQQAQDVGIPLTPQQAQELGITLTPQQAQAQGITLTSQQAQELGIPLIPQQAQAQGITFTPQQAQALGIPFTTQQAQAQGVTLTSQQAQELGITLTPKQTQALDIPLTPQQAQALGIPLTPQQAQELRILLTPWQAQEPGIALTPQELGITLTPQQAQAQGITLTPQQAQALGVPITSANAWMSAVTLTPVQTQALESPINLEQAQEQSLKLGVPLTLDKAHTLGSLLTLNQVQPLGFPFTPGQVQPVRITLMSEHDPKSRASITPRVPHIPKQQAILATPTHRPFQESKASLPTGQSIISRLSPSLRLSLASSAPTAEKSSIFGVSSTPLQMSKLPLNQGTFAPRKPLEMGILPEAETLGPPQTLRSSGQTLVYGGQSTSVQLPAPQALPTPGQLPVSGVPPIPGQPFEQEALSSRELFKTGASLTPLPPQMSKAPLAPRQQLIAAVPPASGQIPSLWAPLFPGQPLVPGASSIHGDRLQSGSLTSEQLQEFQPPTTAEQSPHLQAPSTLGQHLAPWILPGQASSLWIPPTPRQPLTLWPSPTPGKPQRVWSPSFAKKRLAFISSLNSKSELIHPSAPDFKVSQVPFTTKKFQMSEVSDTSEETQILRDPFAIESFRTFQSHLTKYRTPVSQSPYTDEGALPTLTKPTTSLSSLTTLLKTSQISPPEWYQKSRFPPIDKPWILSSVSGTKKPKIMVPPSSPKELEEKRYFVDVEAQKKNLILLNQAIKTCGFPSQLHTTARTLIIEILHMDTVQLGYLFRKYIAYRLIQYARNNIMKLLKAIQNTGKGYEARNLYVMLSRLDDYQKKVMQVWTEKQKSLGQKRNQCLKKMIHVFEELRKIHELNLSQPIPLIIKEKQIPASTTFVQKPFLKLLMEEDRTSDILKKFRQQEDQTEAIWNVDLSTTSYPIAEKTSMHSLWAQLGGYPDIPRLLQLDVQSTFRKSLASLQSQVKKIPKSL
uniref:protein FAM186A isoform X1 n=1 Tax=Callithrix jacchus TaxID=9483 RepID=UPI0023DD1E79|nr:protein FAM186A isoform X1 [Callithrix jacchus]